MENNGRISGTMAHEVFNEATKMKDALTEGAERVYISVSMKNGRYVTNFAKELYAQYTNRQIRKLIKHIDGCDVIECTARRNEEGKITSMYIPIPA